MEMCENRAALNGMERRLFELVSKRATPAQWAEWLRVPLEHALARSYKDLALLLLEAGADGGSGWEGCDGRTLLDAAAEGGNCGLVSTLLATGGMEDLNAVSGDEKMTALHRACEGGHAAAARALVLAGADASLLDSCDRSALHCAVEGGSHRLVEDIVIAGADPTAKDADGNTPLHLAAGYDDDKFVCTLLRRGADVKVANSKGECPLHVAVERDNTRVAEALLKAGAGPNTRYGGHEGNIFPLQPACSSLAMTTTVLLKYGADVTLPGPFGHTALHWAAEKANAGVIDALVEAGADLKTQSSGFTFCYGIYHFDGLTPLHCVTLYRNFEGMVTLLRNGANINAKHVQGRTPLHVATKISARLGVAEAAELLLRWGADETAHDNDGKTPEELIGKDTHLTGRLRRLLTNAPADRVWRRRGMLVMCRAQSTNIQDRTGVCEATPDCVISRVVGLQAAILFQTIVVFL